MKFVIPGSGDVDPKFVKSTSKTDAAFAYFEARKVAAKKGWSAEAFAAVHKVLHFEEKMKLKHNSSFWNELSKYSASEEKPPDPRPPHNVYDRFKVLEDAFKKYNHLFPITVNILGFDVPLPPKK